MVRIGVVVSHRAYERIKMVEPAHDGDFEINYYQYDDIHKAESICVDNQDNVDAYIFGGEYVFRMIKDKSVFEKIPFYTIRFSYKEELYGLLLKLFIEIGTLDLSRTYIDILNEGNGYLGLKEILPPDFFPYAPSCPQDEKYYDNILAESVKLFKEGKIDRYITAAGSIVPKLIEAGLETHYLYPANETIVSTINTVIYDLKIKQLEHDQITVIGNVSLYGVNSKDMELDFEIEERQLALYQALKNFIKIHNIPYAVQKRDANFEIVTSKRILKELTANYTSCSLLEYLKQTLPFKVEIGWGEGQLKMARQKALYANLESGKRRGDCSFVITDENLVIGPLGIENCMTYKSLENGLLNEICQKTKLAPVTIQKLIGLIDQLNTNELTASDIAYYLEITDRSASKIISKLASNGFASELYKKSEKLRGRPKIVFAINLPNDKHDTDEIIKAKP